jgi:hypothetical protein
MMRFRPGLGLLIVCCAGLTACAASAPKGPNVTVHAPAVGRPQPPASVEAALSRDAFSPYAALGESDNDGLAPNESQFTLAQACMSDAGYANVNPGTVPMGIRIDAAGLAFAQPWGDWGYLGDAAAQQYGFLAPAGSALTQLGVDLQPTDPATLPQAEQTAAGKCATIVQNFSTAVQDGPLAGIATLSNDIGSDVQKDMAVKKATHTWSACMTRNGYSFPNPGQVFFSELQTIYGTKGSINIGDPVSSSAQKAQIAAATTDANCTDASDLAGIYFAVQASYEQQLVNANQQALTAAVHRYRAAYAKELGQLKALLRTAKAIPFGRGPGKIHVRGPA